jgi:hypothetical protein
LIAIYHKTEEWNAKRLVFVGNKLGPKDAIIWEEMEKQLTGKIEKLKGRASPSVEKLRELFEPCQLLVVLIDEIIEYVIPALGIPVGGGNFSTQILSFVRNLTEAVRSLKKHCPNFYLSLTYRVRCTWISDT